MSSRGFLGALVLLACDRSTPAAPDGGAGAAAMPVVVAPVARDEPAEPAAATAPLGTPIVLVTDPAALAMVEAAGWSLAAAGFGIAAAENAVLARDPHWRSIVRTITDDVAALADGDAKAGVGLRFTHRLFDVRWLESERAWFELVGVVNRIDRRVFHPGTCGETRLVYRLAHRATQVRQEVRSRLPMTVNVVLWQADDGQGCRTVAQRWLAPEGADVAQHLLADDGPLAAARRGVAGLESIEIDVQTSRWPGTIRPDLGGHATYLLRVFHRDAKRMTAAPLENTPDVAKILGSKRASEQLMEWLRAPATLDAIDRGTAKLPDELSARSSESFTPRGLARLGNRPFSQLLVARQLAELPLADRESIATPAALLRRLDALTCAGCHQSRSIAGFHLLGDEPSDPDRVDALQVGASPHLLGDLERRRAYVLALARGEAPDELRPLADRDPTPGAYGSRCGLGDPGFAALACNDGLLCTAIDDTELGTCLPKTPGAGDACELGTMKTQRDPRRDRVRHADPLVCDRDGVCDGNDVGFPSGMCVVACERMTDDEACGGIVQLKAFNDCLSAGRPFADCVRKSANPAALRACDAEHACRDDYICARAGERGVCMPPYFLYQLRVDGHPA
ncbi:MAG TPA: hypothetical protein VFG69_14470 [Nannocystaceae bacterium]|nr:hypothetical protein [Nannocystaceae bacterium]